MARLGDHFGLGLDHIRFGFDHFLFVFALILLLRWTRPLMAAITSFTIGYSISLGVVAMGWIVIPSPPVEAIVALSIVILATEIARAPDE